ncbi:hypothetical protein [Paraburkholderia sp. GAS32]|uniref:hypothetical protein n=1 Tax=Paraburkholderia sp. GAS32 TaxID=3035129 RepID=UPI003D1D0DC4
MTYVVQFSIEIMAKRSGTAGKQVEDKPAAKPSTLAFVERQASDLQNLERLVAKLDATRAAASIIIEQIGEISTDVSLRQRFILTQGVRSIINTQEQEALREFVDATPVHRFSAGRAELERKAIEAVLSGTEWLTAQEVGKRQNPDATNQHAMASRWRKEGKVFYIEHKGLSLYPKYVFDEFGNPIPEVAEVLRVFEGYRSFRIASWFESTSSMLNGRRPREVLASDPRAVLSAARDHVLGPVHG